MNTYHILPLLLLLAPIVGVAQTPPPAPQDIATDKKEIASDAGKVKDLDAAHAKAMRDLNADFKAQRDAIEDDKSLTPEQRKEKLAALRAEQKTKKDALQDKFLADKRALLKDLKADRRELRADRRERGEERHEMSRERAEGREHGGGRH